MRDKCLCIGLRKKESREEISRAFQIELDLRTDLEGSRVEPKRASVLV